MESNTDSSSNPRKKARPPAEPTIAELEQQLKAAQAACDRLDQQASDLDLEASQADAIFRTDPNSASHSSSAIAKQRAENAKAQAQAAALDRDHLAAQLEARKRDVRIAELQPIANFYPGARERVRARLTLMTSAIGAEVQTLARELEASNAARAEIAALLGQEPSRPATLGALRESLQADLAGEFSAAGRFDRGMPLRSPEKLTLLGGEESDGSILVGIHLTTHVEKR